MNKGYPSRKSLPQIVEAFAAFRARHAEALLYLHTDLSGIYQEGIDLAPLLHAFGLDPEIVRFPDQYRYQFDPVRRRVHGGRLLLARRAAQPGDGRGIRAAGARGAGLRRAGDRDRLHRDERGLRSRLEGAATTASGRRCGPGRPGRTWRRSSRASSSASRCPSEDRRELGARAREHALLYDADRVLEEHWLPALDGDRAPARRPPAARIAAQGCMRPSRS